jgi:hypothetical protein
MPKRQSKRQIPKAHTPKPYHDETESNVLHRVPTGQRKKAIASLWLQGLEPLEIANRTGYDEDTVRYHIRAIEDEAQAFDKDKAKDVLRTMFLRVIDQGNNSLYEIACQAASYQTERDLLKAELKGLTLYKPDPTGAHVDKTEHIAKRMPIVQARIEWLNAAILRMYKESAEASRSFIDNIVRVGVPQFAEGTEKEGTIPSPGYDMYSRGNQDKDGALSEALDLRRRQLKQLEDMREVKERKGKKNG